MKNYILWHCPYFGTVTRTDFVYSLGILSSFHIKLQRWWKWSVRQSLRALVISLVISLIPRLLLFFILVTAFSTSSFSMHCNHLSSFCGGEIHSSSFINFSTVSLSSSFLYSSLQYSVHPSMMSDLSVIVFACCLRLMKIAAAIFF